MFYRIIRLLDNNLLFLDLQSVCLPGKSGVRVDQMGELCSAIVSTELLIWSQRNLFKTYLIVIRVDMYHVCPLNEQKTLARLIRERKK